MIITHTIIPDRRKQMPTILLIQIYLGRAPNVLPISPRTARLIDVVHIRRTTPASTMRRAHLCPSSPAVSMIGLPTAPSARQRADPKEPDKQQGADDGADDNSCNATA